MQENANFKNYREVLAYAGECNRKVGKSKLFADVSLGRLKKQPDGSFKKRDVKRYFASLPMAGTTDVVAERVADRQRRREEEEIRRIKAVADKEEFDLAVKKGRFVAKEKVHLELAARAVTLASGLKSGLEAQALDLIALVEGNPKKAAVFLGKLEELLDEAMNEYSRPMELTVEFEPDEPKVSSDKEAE